MKLFLIILLLFTCSKSNGPKEITKEDIGIIRKELKSGIKIYAIRTGWVGIKKTHYELNVPEIFVFPTILFQSTWHEWMPIISYIVIHPKAIILIDTGPALNQNQEDYYSCDPHNEFFYKRAMRFLIPENEILANRLKQINISEKSIQYVLITHFHGDHIGGLNEFKNQIIYTGAGNLPKHIGSFTCKIDSNIIPKEIPFEVDSTNEFGKSFSLTKDNKIKLVPLIGHTPGHSGLFIDDETAILFVGDATFNEDQTSREAVSGVTENIALAKETQRTIKKFLTRKNSILLPSHDSTIFEKLK